MDDSGRSEVLEAMQQEKNRAWEAWWSHRLTRRKLREPDHDGRENQLWAAYEEAVQVYDDELRARMAFVYRHAAGAAAESVGVQS